MWASPLKKGEKAFRSLKNGEVDCLEELADSVVEILEGELWLLQRICSL